jgi:putative endonuclease
MRNNWYVYIAECNDGSFYTGITNNLGRREREHNTDNTLGAKSLRGKRPVKIVYFECYNSRSRALKRERAIKDWKREDKIGLIQKKNKGFIP